MQTRIKQWLINKAFEREYQFFVYPFETVDYLISKLPKDVSEEGTLSQAQYLEDVRRFYKSEAFQMEMTEFKKLFYKQLALSTKDDIERAGYRLCMLFIRKLERRYKYLSEIKLTK